MFRASRPKGASGLPCKAYQLPDHQVGGSHALGRRIRTKLLGMVVDDGARFFIARRMLAWLSPPLIKPRFVKNHDKSSATSFLSIFGDKSAAIRFRIPSSKAARAVWCFPRQDTLEEHPTMFGCFQIDLSLLELQPHNGADRPLYWYRAAAPLPPKGTEPPHHAKDQWVGR